MGRETPRCWYWPLILLYVVQKPIATNILKTCMAMSLILISLHLYLENINSAHDNLEEQFQIEKCHVLLLHLSPTSKLSLVQECGVESAAWHHRDLTVCLGIGEQDYLEEVRHSLRNRENLEIFHVNPEDLMKGTPGEDLWKEHSKAILQSRWSSKHMTRLLSLSWLWKHGGLFIDNDFMILQDLYHLNSSYVTFQSYHPFLGMSVDVVRVPKHHPFILHWFSFLDSYDSTKKGEWAEERATKALLDYCEEELEVHGGREIGRHDDIVVLEGVRCQNNLRILNRNAFHPISLSDWKEIFSADPVNIKYVSQMGDEEKEVAAIKMWNQYSASILTENIKEESGFVLLSALHCPNIFYRSLDDQIHKKKKNIGRKGMELIMKMRIAPGAK